jgi:asparagine synthase (glutamine-hydrolysing)
VCGIFGYSGEDVSFFRSSISPTLESIEHRGPDSQGFHVGERVILGHSRLAIIDLHPEAQQPMSNEDKRYHIAYNGELYNYLELRKILTKNGVDFETNSDTEVVLKAFIFWGDEAFAKFRGMFAIAIWDEQESCLILARDCFGEKPLYFARKSNELFFSSELRSLIEFSKIESTLNKDAVNLYIHYQFVPEPFTLIQGIEKIEPGSVLRFFSKSGELTKLKYLDIFSEHRIEISGQNIEEHSIEIRKRLRKAVERCMVADAPIVIALSGGIDSSSIVKFAVDLEYRVEVISVGYPGHPTYDERTEAKNYAKELGVKFHEVEISTEKMQGDFLGFVWQMDEPIADPAAYAHYSVARKAKELGYKVLISGIGGDELFWGYEWLPSSAEASQQRFNGSRDFKRFRGILRQSRSRRLNLIKRQSYFFYETLPDFLSPFKIKKAFFTKEMLEVDDSRLFSIAGRIPLTEFEVKPGIARALGTTWLSGNCLALADKVSMANSIESRMPFLDVDLAMYAYSLNYQFDILSLGRKQLLIKALQGLLPDHILERRKTGFQPPVTEWMTSVLNSQNLKFMDSELVKQGVITKKAADRVANRSKSRDWPEIFFEYKLLLLEIWLKKLKNEGK